MAGGWLYASSIIVVIAFADNHSACIISNSFELVAGDTAGLLLTIAFVVSGAFLDEPILFCGHAMMQRLYAFTGEGITLRQTILWTGITSVTSVIVGARHLSKKDLIR